ncbi:CsgE family curli-type amyloid fiber assembly protein [Massilia sp. CCM 9210]|uniref:CsgE family curli-type amyloid fiber assembly protein n=1 Tax=Massilia scottii TaxID=3057166 RepID=UPI002796AAF7|nr:CsgE family curli-type amyloid fiber assembly protein [Massilia sp. CCM 9210]MDQ1812733.1 CsgE family curli-type amyloid fiber assembly protein [Massilia sp. CCM 9210]
MSPTTTLLAICALSLGCGLSATASQTSPQDAPDKLGNAGRMLALDTDSGVVTSQAVTVAGHDFCQYFIAAWREKEGSERYTLAIVERPSARRGSEVRIDFAQRRVFETRLPTARGAIKSLSEDAAERTYQAVLQADAERQSIIDADLAPDEF